MKSRNRPLLSGLSILGVLLISTAPLIAQRGYWGGGGDDWRRYAVPVRDIFPSNSFTFCRIEYTQGWGGRGRRGGGWRTDYPDSDLNFSLRLSQLTTINVNRDENDNYQHAIVRLDEPDLFKYPFIYMIEVGALEMTPPEIEGLRSYLLRGGFLLVDDFWGDDQWDNWEYEISQVLPPEEYPMFDIPLDHEIFHIVFELNEVPQIPSVGHYWQWETTGQTYEGQWTTDTKPHCRGIADKEGRLMAVVMHNTDLGDGWEQEARHEGYFREFSAKKAYPMGINIVVYAMTH